MPNNDNLKVSGRLDDWLRIAKGVSVVAIAAVLIYAVANGIPTTFDTPYGKVTIGSVPTGPALGTDGQPRMGSDFTVWESVCPSKTVPISGSCIADSPVPLQNIGVNEQKWECAWSGPVPKATVKAVCLTTP